MTTYANYIKHDILSKEKEKELAIAYKSEKDLKAREQLILHNLRLVHSIAHEYRVDHHKMDDLIQQGMIGLTIAPDKFNLDKGVPFSNYASWWIRAYILKYITEDFSIVKIGTTNNQRKIFWSLSKERQKIESRGVVATADLLAENMNVKKEEIEEMAARMSCLPVSIDRHINDDEKKNHYDSLLPTTPSPEEGYDQRELEQKIQALTDKFKETLNPMRAYILENRLLKSEPDTLEAIAKEMCRSRERIRQLEVILKEKLLILFKDNGLSEMNYSHV